MRLLSYKKLTNVITKKHHCTHRHVVGRGKNIKAKLQHSNFAINDHTDTHRTE